MHPLRPATRIFVAAGVAFAAWLPVGCAPPGATERAQALVRQHREDEAVTALRTRLASHPEDVPARRLLVRVLALAGDLVSARAEVAELGKRLPADDPAPYIELGHALELTHRYDDALEAYDEASRTAPLSPVGPREAGMRSAHWGESELARPRLEEALRRGAHDVDTWHALGVVRLNLGDDRGAEEAYRAAAAADPASATPWLGLATVGVVRGDPALALSAYDAVLERKPRFAAAHLGRAWALARLGRKSEASQAIDRAQALGAPAENVARQRAALATQDGPP
jgi:cytochrome c-type biogenesis protein CcmH/NrfG